MIINNNISALNNFRQMGINQTANAKSMEKLSSGLRINRAGDDAAGLAISEKMRGQIRGLNQASRNAQDSISLIQTAEGALNETHNILQRMRELSVQAANDTNTSTDREEIQKEINQLTSEINRIGNTTEFNTKKILNGNVGENVGANRGIYEVGLNATLTDGQTLVIDSQTFTYKETGVANTMADPNSQEFSDVNSLAEALKNNTAIAEKYDVAVTNDNKIRLMQKFGQETATAPTVGGNAQTGNAATVVSAGVSGTSSQALKMQIGANQNQSMSIDINNMTAKALGIAASGSSSITGFASTGVTNGTNNEKTEKALDVSTHENASAAVTVINNAIETVSTERSKLGAFQNRLEHTIANLNNSSENLQAAESRIRDVDMAKEIMEFTKTNILSQASQSMLAQANQKPQSVLQLLG